MKLSKLYALIVRYGVSRDPRQPVPKEPFADTGILFGDPGTEIKKILVGIDIEVAELLLADRIRQREGLDLVMSHHPEGYALIRLGEVMQLQVDILRKIGLPVRVSQELMDERMREVERRLLPQNYMRSPDAARLLELPFICVHTPADNHVYAFIKELLQKQKPRTVQDIITILLEQPEYQEAVHTKGGPRIILGAPHRRVGKISVEMTGGTEGPRDVFDKMYKSGVRTLVCMHLSEEHFKKAKVANLNVVIAGHISSDNIGLNLLLDRIEEKEPLQIIGCSGFRRVKRT